MITAAHNTTSNAPFAYSVGRNRADAHPSVHRADSFDELQDRWLSARHDKPKDSAPYFARAFTGNGDDRPQRAQQYAEPCAWIALDVDQLTPDAAQRLTAALAERRGFWHASLSATDDELKRRVVLECSRVVELAEHRQVVAAVEAWLQAKVGDGIAFDHAASADVARLWYLPSEGAAAGVFGGEPIDVDRALEYAKRSRPEPERQATDGQRIGAGGRNAALVREAGKLRRIGLSPAELAAALHQINRDRCEPPLDDAEVETIARSVGRYQPEDHPAGDEIAPVVDWPQPQPLPDALAPVAPFDSAMLPACLRAWVDDIADRVQCPHDFVAVAAVAAMGAVLGRKVAIRPQAHTDWSEVANQWALVIGRPGVLKSPAIEQATSPLRRLEAVARDRFREQETTFRADTLASKLRAKVNERDAEKALAKDRNADVRKYLSDDDIEQPICRRYSTSDTSVESLAELVRLNPNGLLVHRDEMVSLLRDLDREEKAGARGFYLTGWNGSTPYTSDRIGRGFDLHIPAVCISLLGGTQPARIAQYVHAATHGGSGDDGLIQRFGLMVWPDLSGEWKNIDRWPETTAKRAAFDAFTRLDEIDPATVGAAQDTDFDGEPAGAPFLRLDDTARDLFVEWRSDLERRLRSHELAPALESHLAKYRKLVPSLALLFHLADGNTGPVQQAPLLRALAWGEYLESHARRIYGSGPASEAATARAILDHIRKGDLPAVFAGWQVWRPGWAGLADRVAVSDGIAMLVDFGYLGAEQVKTTGRTATRYTVNPKALP